MVPLKGLYGVFQWVIQSLERGYMVPLKGEMKQGDLGAANKVARAHDVSNTLINRRLRRIVGCLSCRTELMEKQ